MNTGLITDPMTLQEALSSGRIVAGCVIYLRGGIYSGDFSTSLNGTFDNLITIQPYQNEKPIIDGSLLLNGSYLRIKNVEIKYTGWTTRLSAIEGSNPTDMPQNSLTVNTIGVELVNCIIHDLLGYDLWKPAINAKMYGCLVYNIGWNSILGTRGHGHSIYTQNETGRKLIKRNIFCNSFGYGWHAYTENEHIDNFDFIENTSFGSGKNYIGGKTPCLIGGLVDSNTSTIDKNMFYQNGLQLGYGGHDVIDFTLTNNYAPSGISIDAGSTFIINSGNTTSAPESGKRVFVTDNEYQSDRAQVTIYNWDNDDSVEVDLTTITGLSVGDSIIFHCAENYHDCTQTLTLDTNKKVVVDMRAVSHTVATAIGHDYTPPTTFPTFGCFVVKKA